MLAWYANRGGYLMATGRPAAQVACTIRQQHVDGRQRRRHQHHQAGLAVVRAPGGVDYFDEQSLSSVATIADGGFKDLSGQVFRAIVVPSSTVITRTGLERFKAFVKAAAS